MKIAPCRRDDSSSLRNAPIRVVENVSPIEMTLHFDSRNL